MRDVRTHRAVGTHGAWQRWPVRRLPCCRGRGGATSGIYLRRCHASRVQDVRLPCAHIPAAGATARLHRVGPSRRDRGGVERLHAVRLPDLRCRGGVPARRLSDALLPSCQPRVDARCADRRPARGEGEYTVNDTSVCVQGEHGSDGQRIAALESALESALRSSARLLTACAESRRLLFPGLFTRRSRRGSLPGCPTPQSPTLSPYPRVLGESLNGHARSLRSVRAWRGRTTRRTSEVRP